MKTIRCEICDGPVVLLDPKDLARQCTRCFEKPENTCKAPGCQVEVPPRGWGFCHKHFDTAYRCSQLGCFRRSPANDPYRQCRVHARHRRTA